MSSHDYVDDDMDDEKIDRLEQSFYTNNELMAAVRRAEQHLHNHVRQNTTPDHKPFYTDIDVMTLAFSYLTDEQRHYAVTHDLFIAYCHHRRYLQEQDNLATAARLEGFSFLEHDDLDMLSYSQIFVVDDDSDTARNMMDVMGLSEDVVPEGSALVPIDAVWRIIQEIKLLKFRESLHTT